MPPLLPAGMTKETKLWVPKFEEFQSLYGKWIEEWNRLRVQAVTCPGRGAAWYDATQTQDRHRRRSA